MVGPENRAVDDVALSALIDDELPEGDAERTRARLRGDPNLARRFAEMIEVTSEIRASYDNAVEVICTVAELHARAIREACVRAVDSGAPLAAVRGRERSATVPVREVDRAIASLTSEQRSVLCLAVFEERSYFEIAETLCVRPRAVMQWLAEARSALRASLRGRSIVAVASQRRRDRTS